MLSFELIYKEQKVYGNIDLINRKINIQINSISIDKNDIKKIENKIFPNIKKDDIIAKKINDIYYIIKNYYIKYSNIDIIGK